MLDEGITCRKSLKDTMVRTTVTLQSVRKCTNSLFSNFSRPFDVLARIQHDKQIIFYFQRLSQLESKGSHHIVPTGYKIIFKIIDSDVNIDKLFAMSCSWKGHATCYNAFAQ